MSNPLAAYVMTKLEFHARLDYYRMSIRRSMSRIKSDSGGNTQAAMSLPLSYQPVRSEFYEHAEIRVRSSSMPPDFRYNVKTTNKGKEKEVMVKSGLTEEEQYILDKSLEMFMADANELGVDIEGGGSDLKLDVEDGGNGEGSSGSRGRDTGRAKENKPKDMEYVKREGKRTGKESQDFKVLVKALQAKARSWGRNRREVVVSILGGLGGPWAKAMSKEEGRPYDKDHVCNMPAPAERKGGVDAKKLDGKTIWNSARLVRNDSLNIHKIFEFIYARSAHHNKVRQQIAKLYYDRGLARATDAGCVEAYKAAASIAPLKQELDGTYFTEHYMKLEK